MVLQKLIKDKFPNARVYPHYSFLGVDVGGSAYQFFFDLGKEVQKAGLDLERLSVKTEDWGTGRNYIIFLGIPFIQGEL